MDFKYVCIVIRDTIKKIIIKFIWGGVPDGTQQKT